ncbi:hypothetical protein L218DRAFT_1056139 [Marasmius fiardii PR-910]|nr:hypothetical protein L218DRAFT_1056139 [Marasmius fiardii PR-910]
MRHILFECKENGQQEIWQLAKAAWMNRKSRGEWPKIGMGALLACGQPLVMKKPMEKDTRRKVLIRAVTTDRPSASHLATARPAPSREILNKWLYTIKTRRKIDLLLTNQNRYGKKSIPKAKVRNTWKGREDWDYLRAEGARETGSLVGIGCHRGRAPRARRHRLSPTRAPRRCLQAVSSSRITRGGLMSSPPIAKLFVPAVSF